MHRGDDLKSGLRLSLGEPLKEPLDALMRKEVLQCDENSTPRNALRIVITSEECINTLLSISNRECFLERMRNPNGPNKILSVF